MVRAGRFEAIVAMVGAVRSTVQDDVAVAVLPVMPVAITLNIWVPSVSPVRETEDPETVCDVPPSIV